MKGLKQSQTLNLMDVLMRKNVRYLPALHDKGPPDAASATIPSQSKRISSGTTKVGLGKYMIILAPIVNHCSGQML
jgi:hypothetical protein